MPAVCVHVCVRSCGQARCVVYHIRSVCCATGAHVPEAEIHEAQEKFVESKDLAETAMFNLLENDVSILLLLHFNAVFQTMLGSPDAVLWSSISFGRVRPGVNFQQRGLPGLPWPADITVPSTTSLVQSPPFITRPAITRYRV